MPIFINLFRTLKRTLFDVLIARVTGVYSPHNTLSSPKASGDTYNRLLSCSNAFVGTGRWNRPKHRKDLFMQVTYFPYSVVWKISTDMLVWGIDSRNAIHSCKVIDWPPVPPPHTMGHFARHSGLKSCSLSLNSCTEWEIQFHLTHSVTERERGLHVVARRKGQLIHNPRRRLQQLRPSIMLMTCPASLSLSSY